MPFRFSQLELSSNLFLSPLAGYTNLPFRLIIREIGGAGLCTTDLVNARSLLEKNRKALKLIESSPEDRPLAIQLFGSVAEEMRDAALFLESQGVAAVDINMGCPVRKVCKIGAGSSMMLEYEKAVHLIRMIVDAVKIPVSCKMRLGWDNNNITAPDLARRLEDTGVAWITVHGRTREQGFSGKVNLTGIRSVVQAVRHLPVIGNGDITTPQDAKRMFEETACAAVSIGRGAFYNPWIFQHTLHYLTTGEILPDPSFEERLCVMSKHLDRMIEVFGEETGCRMFRKVATWYSKRFGPAAEFNRRVVNLCTRQEFDEIVEAYKAWRQQILDKVQVPHTSSILSTDFRVCEPAIAHRDTIPVPQGPNEQW